MRWRKLGRIFQAKGQYDWMTTHAAVPFGMHLQEDVYQIFFSTRDKKNRSHVGYIIVDLGEPTKYLGVSSHPVLGPGSLGTFDDSGAMLSWITKRGRDKYLYYIGWNLGVTVPFRNAIGLAISANDACQCSRYSDGPIIDRSVSDPFFVASCCVLLEEDVWRMWYLSCTKWEIVNGRPQHWYHLKYADSKDRADWTRKGAVAIDYAHPGEYAISRPSVLKDGQMYRMWYSWRGARYRIGYAESADGTTWVRKDDQAGIDVSHDGWDAEMIEYPHVFQHRDTYYMLYNGNDYGKTGFGLAVLEESW